MAPLIWKCQDRTLDLSQVAVMGILNVTPDSFSDGGEHESVQAALTAARTMLRDGAAIIDVGGESTRPGAEPVPAEVELRRVVPVIAALRSETDCLISIDTMKADVARAALKAGARIINDVSALTADPAMTPLVAETGAGVVLMHMQGTPQTMQLNPQYENVVTDLIVYLRARFSAAVAAGVAPEAIVLDPGIGFGKTFEHNLELLRRFDEFAALPRPLLVGPSRKGFLGRITGAAAGQRQPETIAAATAAVLAGARIVRVHDVELVARAMQVAAALRPPAGKG